jgi:hypothetical protein
MNAVASHPLSESSSSATETVAVEILRLWSRACGQFLERERREIIQAEPSPEKFAGHLRELKAMIRLTAAMLGQVSDPDFPARHFAAEIKGRLLQLEDSWDLLNNPMTPRQADELLVQCFPENAPGA